MMRGLPRKFLFFSPLPSLSPAFFSLPLNIFSCLSSDKCIRSTVLVGWAKEEKGRGGWG